METNNNIFPSNDMNSSVKHATDTLSAANEQIQGNTKKVYGVVFLSAVTGISALIGFGTAIASVRKRDPKFFEEGVVGAKGISDSGAALAIRALGWGSFYAVTGCGILFYGIWKLSGANNAKEFREKMGSILPKIPKNNPPTSRTEFDGLNDLLTYISEDWGKNKTKDSKKP